MAKKRIKAYYPLYRYNKAHKQREAKTDDQKPGKVRAVPIDEYVDDKLTNHGLPENHIENSNQIEHQQTENLQPPQEPTRFVDIYGSLEEWPVDDLFELWNNRNTYIETRNDAAIPLSYLRFKSGIDKTRQDPRAFYENSLISEFPLIDVAIELKVYERQRSDFSHPGLVSEVVRFAFSCERIKRDAAFRERVLKKYGNTCVICGYGIHVEAAHLRSKHEISDDRVENGVPLCPNHHWEFDNGHIGNEAVLQARDGKGRKN